MGTTEDDIGIWNDLGTLTPNATNWVKYPVVATGANDTIRITFSSSNFSKINSLVWLRPRYQTADSDQVGQAIRIYPKPEKQVVQVPIPQDFRDRSVYFRAFEIKKQLKYRKYIGITPDTNYMMKLEELWG
jgi:hypothetical protein